MVLKPPFNFCNCVPTSCGSTIFNFRLGPCALPKESFLASLLLFTRSLSLLDSGKLGLLLIALFGADRVIVGVLPFLLPTFKWLLPFKGVTGAEDPPAEPFELCFFLEDGSHFFNMLC